MDYETADGSQFSLRDIWHERDGEPYFAYTSVTAFVDGKAYAGKVDKDMDLIDDEDVLGYLEPVPADCIHPLFHDDFTKAPPLDTSRHYLKLPSFTYDDCQPGQTFVADCLLTEVAVLEQLKRHPHPNIVTYYGCVVADGRIQQLCLEKYRCSLTEYIERHGTRLPTDEAYTLLDEVEAGVQYLHSLRLAHNDINPDNICIDEKGTAVLVDFDSCLAFGEKLSKGFASQKESEPVSDPENDRRGLEDLAAFLIGP